MFRIYSKFGTINNPDKMFYQFTFIFSINFSRNEKENGINKYLENFQFFDESLFR